MATSIQELEYVKNVAEHNDSKLASKYLKLVRECPEKFDSCFYNDVADISGCSCPSFYIFFARPLDLTENDCTVFNRSEITQHDLHIRKTLKDLKILSAYLPNKNLTIQKEYENINITLSLNSKSSQSVFELCTCIASKCNTKGLPASNSSLQCYTKRNTDPNPKLSYCTQNSNVWIKKLRYLKRVGNHEASKLASYYLPLFEDCKNNFDSCIYKELSESSACACPFQYIVYIRSLKLEKDSCSYFSGFEVSMRRNELMELIKRTRNDFRKIDSYLVFKKEKMFVRASMENLINFKALMSKRQADHYKICTCVENKCNTFPPGPRPEKSLQCYVESNLSVNDESELRLKNCSDKTNRLIDILQYVIKMAPSQYSTIASKYLKIVKNCRAEYDSCIILAIPDRKLFDCFCPITYIISGPRYYPSSSSKECTEVSSTASIFIKSRLQLMQDDFQKIQDYIKQTESKSRSITNDLIIFSDGSIGMFGQTNLRICTCIGSKCNTNDIKSDLDLSTTPLRVHEYDRYLPTAINNVVTLSFSNSRLLSLIIKIIHTFM